MSSRSFELKGLFYAILLLAFFMLTTLPRGYAQDTPPQSPDQTQPQEQTPPPQQNPPNPDKTQEPEAKPQAGQPSETPPEKKDEGANPVQTVEDKTKQAAELTKDATTAGLKKVRDWESGWITGIYIGKDRARVPLTTEERRQVYFQQTLATPGAYLKRMFAAGIDQARGAPSQWDDGWGGYAERWASREGQFITANSLAALGNAKLGYEVRYDQCRCSGFWPRLRHAVVRNFVTYGRDEETLHPQWALYGGALGGGLLSTAWKPKPRNAFAEGGRAALQQAGWGTLLNFFIEFSTEINRKQGVKK
jgi:hypothetical protein